MELNDKNKEVIDRMFVNGFNRVEAWSSVYPTTQHKYISSSVHQMLVKPHAKEYYQLKHEEYKDALSVDKYVMVEKLLNQIDMFDAMILLASKDKLTITEEEKLERLTALVKGADIMKAKDMICKLIDAYTPIKVKVENVTYNVGFEGVEGDE